MVYLLWDIVVHGEGTGFLNGKREYAKGGPTSGSVVGHGCSEVDFAGANGESADELAVTGAVVSSQGSRLEHHLLVPHKGRLEARDLYGEGVLQGFLMIPETLGGNELRAAN